MIFHRSLMTNRLLRRVGGGSPCSAVASSLGNLEKFESYTCVCKLGCGIWDNRKTQGALLLFVFHSQFRKYRFSCFLLAGFRYFPRYCYSLSTEKCTTLEIFEDRLVISRISAGNWNRNREIGSREFTLQNMKVLCIRYQWTRLVSPNQFNINSLAQNCYLAITTWKYFPLFSPGTPLV